MNVKSAIIACLLLCLSSVSLHAGHHKKGEVKAAKSELKPLFNGKDLTGFTTKGNWVVEEEGVLTIRPREGETGWKRYDMYLWFPGQHADFEAELEYKHGKGGNSGFYFRCGDNVDPTKSGLEVQILDSHGKNKQKWGHHDCGGIIRTAGPSEMAAKPAGEWNHLYVKAKGDFITVILNGKKIHDKLDLSKTASKNKPKKGYIALQDHGLLMHFRNIKFKSLD